MMSNEEARRAAAAHARMLRNETERLRRMVKAEERNRRRLPPAFQAPWRGLKR